MEYNGYKNYETWNIALHIKIDEILYDFAKQCKLYNPKDPYSTFVKHQLIFQTKDAVRLNDPKIDKNEINQLINEL